MSAKSKVAKMAATAMMAGLIGGAGVSMLGCASDNSCKTCQNGCKAANGCKATGTATATPTTQPAADSK